MEITDLRTGEVILNSRNGAIEKQGSYSGHISLFTHGGYRVDMPEWELRELLSRHYYLTPFDRSIATQSQPFGVLKPTPSTDQPDSPDVPEVPY